MLLQQYQERWPRDFLMIEVTIMAGLSGLDISMEHIGSTAIRNLAAKPTVDIDLFYGKNEEYTRIKEGLEKIGYDHHGDQGIVDRKVFKRSTADVKHRVLDRIHHHLYVCPAHSVALKRHLLFRDYLRNNEEARLQYQAIKYHLAKQAKQDRKVYAQMKELQAREFVDLILLRAQAQDDKM